MCTLWEMAALIRAEEEREQKPAAQAPAERETTAVEEAQGS